MWLNRENGAVTLRQGDGASSARALDGKRAFDVEPPQPLIDAPLTDAPLTDAPLVDAGRSGTIRWLRESRLAKLITRRP